MAILFERNQVLLAKVETTRGVDAVPTATNNAIKCAVINPTVDGQQLDNPVVKNSISAEPKKFVNKEMSFSIQTPLKGSGTAGTAPEISPLLQSCAMSETVDSGVSVAYSPVNSDASMKSCTIYLYKDGVCYKAVGCMGNFSVSNSAGEYPMITFNMRGKFVSVADAVNPSSPVYQSTEPIEVKAYGFKFGSWEDAVCRNFDFETGNTITSRRNINAADGIESSGITARDPLWSANIEAVLEATNGFWSDFINRSTVALEFSHGTVAGNIVEFSAPAVNYDAPTPSSEDGINMYGLGGQMLEDEGEDNFTLTYK